MEGIPLRTSVRNRNAMAKGFFPYSERYIPVMIPMGRLMQLAKPTRMSVPTIAFANPPPGSPTGFGSSVKNSQFSAENPSDIVL
jgi:hypothetical protein